MRSLSTLTLRNINTQNNNTIAFNRGNASQNQLSIHLTDSLQTLAQIMATFVDDSDCGHTVQGLVVINCAQNTTNNIFIESVSLIIIINSNTFKLFIFSEILRHLSKISNEWTECEPKHLNFGFDATVDGFDMKIDNKYYSANILLFDVRDKHLFNQCFADSVNGVIIHFDSNEVIIKQLF